MLFHLDLALAYGLKLKSFVTASNTPADVFTAEAQYCLDHNVPKFMVLASGFSTPRALAESLYPDEKTFLRSSGMNGDGLYGAFKQQRMLAQLREEQEELVDTQSGEPVSVVQATPEPVAPLEIVVTGLRNVGCTELHVGGVYDTVKVDLRGQDLEKCVPTGVCEVEVLEHLDRMVTQLDDSLDGSAVPLTVQQQTQLRDEQNEASHAQMHVLQQEYGEFASELLSCIPFERWFGPHAGGVLKLCCVASEQFAIAGLAQQYRLLLKPGGGEMDKVEEQHYRVVLGIGLLYLLFSVPVKCERRGEDARWLALRVVAWHVNLFVMSSVLWKRQVGWSTWECKFGAKCAVDLFPVCTGMCRLGYQSLGGDSYASREARRRVEHPD